MNNLKEKFHCWFMASRGYSISMSILNWLVAFVVALKFCQNANIIYAFVALLGIVFAHLGTNFFDDYIDFILKVPKQDCKMKYLKEGIISKNQLLAICGFLFLIAAVIGIYFYIKIGIPILIITIITAAIIILYPKLNNFALGEVAVGLCFGLLLFAGLSYVITGTLNLNMVLISIPVGILTSSVLFVHSIMDFDSDKNDNKCTLCVLLKSKSAALFVLMMFYLIIFIFTLLYVYLKILPVFALISLILILLIVKLYRSIKNTFDNSSKNDFINNFTLGRNIALFYNIVIILSLLIK